MLKLENTVLGNFDKYKLFTFIKEWFYEQNIGADCLL